MSEIQETKPIEVSDLTRVAQEMLAENCRLVQIGCAQLSSGIEINYTFDKEYAFKNFRITIPDNQIEIPSISSTYLCAFLYENELHDLYGIKFSGIAIDYQGKFYKKSMATPFYKESK